jgi:hypothetical protein
VRIETTNRMTGVARSGAMGRMASSGAFTLPGASPAAGVMRTAPLAPVAALEAILALQAVGDVMGGRRRRAVKRGSAMLDLLEGIKADLLVGGVDPDRLDQLADQLVAMRDTVEPGLDSLLDDIELRVRVELAKFGRFPPL